ncbi:hypothetical protein AB0B57_33195 [Micromonospora sp. NPDC049101]|uniref:hypothetical protein n=1 Tax=Micromonospora sp. NPDC049101 TaxID=3155032 RepID=UPI0033FADDA0
MIRLALRQFRTSTWTAVLGLVAVAAVALATRPHFADAAAAAQRACGSDPHCPALTAFVLDNTTPRTVFGLVVTVVPPLIGAFWGAPLVAREFEAGTYRLVWTQSISRSRWLAVKLAVVGTVTVVATALLSALVTWWATPLDRAAAAVYGTFDQRDIVPIAPRVVSMPLDPATTGYGSGGNILFGVGPSALEPTTPDIPNAWIQSVRVVNAAGLPLTDQVLRATCPGLGEGPQGPAGPASEAARQRMYDCVRRIGENYHEVVTYQPGDRYWTFQWWELALFVLLTVLLCGYAYYRLRRFRG